MEKLPLAVNSVAEFPEVLVVSDGGDATVGSPYVEGAKVLAQVQSHYRDRKVIVFKYKAKNRYRRMRGHRQEYTRLMIQDIQVGEPAPRPARRRTRRAAAPADGEGQGGSA